MTVIHPDNHSQHAVTVSLLRWLCSFKSEDRSGYAN